VTFVLDNSVAMRWCFKCAAHPYADDILKRLAAGEEAGRALFAGRGLAVPRGVPAKGNAPSSVQSTVTPAALLACDQMVIKRGERQK
jgi:hypothetical protein